MDISLSTHETALVARAAAHALAEEATPALARFTNGVDDLDVARLIMRIERGSVIVPSAVSRAWLALNEIEREPHLTRIVKEAIRVGLVYPGTIRTGPHLIRVQLVAAPVHLRRVPGVPVCPESQEKPYGRYRTLDEAAWVDCSACLSTLRLPEKV